MGDRDLEARDYSGNPLLNWPEEAGRIRTACYTLILAIARYLPMKLKNPVLRSLGTEIGENTAIGLEVQLDIFYPEKITIGSETTIGYGTTILTHETTQEEFRTGEVEIGDNVLIGANTTVLPGVSIGDDATVSAHSLVNRDVEEGEKAGGIPVENLEEG
ncbi:MAG: DapH/DapD/GlmU-related protein [Candidatus Nanosalina sp.]